jgi:hypothetical protein
LRDEISSQKLPVLVAPNRSATDNINTQKDGVGTFTNNTRNGFGKHVYRWKSRCTNLSGAAEDSPEGVVAAARL